MMRANSFLRSVLFGAVAAAGWPLWLLLAFPTLGWSMAQALYLIAVTALYIAALAPSRPRGFVAAVIAALADDAAFFRRLSLDTIGVIPDAGGGRGVPGRPAARQAGAGHRRPAGRPALGRRLDGLLAGRAGREPRHPQADPEQHRPVPPVPPRRLPRQHCRSTGSRPSWSGWRGAPLGGGPAGFGIAPQNDAPMAAKAHVLAKAFLAAEMKCARCHDAPFHPYDQADLFGLAAHARGQAAGDPGDQHRPAAARRAGCRRSRSRSRRARRSSPHWTSPRSAPTTLPDGLDCPRGADPRERLAALITVAARTSGSPR